MGEGEKYYTNQFWGFWDKSVGVRYAVIVINFCFPKKLMVGGGMV